MTTAQWAIEHIDNVAAFLVGHGIDLTDEVKSLLAEHVDDEISGYCDDCDQIADPDRAREPTAAEEAMHTGEHRG